MIRIILSALALIMCCETASALPCLTKEQATATGKHAKYRQVGKVRCYYTGKRVPAKSEFSLPATASARARCGNRDTQPCAPGEKYPAKAPPSQGKGYAGEDLEVASRPRANNHAGEPTALTAVEVPSGRSVSRPGVPQTRRGEPAPDDGLNNVLATLCGGPCPDFRGMDLHGMQARLEAAHAAFMFLQAMR